MEKLITFDQVLAKAKSLSSVTVAVAAAADKEVLEAVMNAKQHGLASFQLYGDQQEIERISEEIGLVLDSTEQIIDVPSVQVACEEAVSAVRHGRADVVMKGMVQTSDFMRAILHKEKGLRSGKVLSHVASFEVSGYDRLIHVTDPALNVAPELQEKFQIMENVVEFCHALGCEQPKIAALAAVEVVNPKMTPTLDAAALTQMNRRKQLKGAIVDGPFALDNAISLEAAIHKGIDSPVAGQADVLLVPDIEAGNMLYKSMVYFAKAKIGALVLGAKAPVVLTSRADSAEAKLYSIALAVIQAAKR
jgi:phosphate butyryltransferase